ncbi:TPA: hypothetical protein ACSC58_005427 [Bacillus paranthracis]
MDRKTNSTWREQSITLPPKTVYDVVFPDTKPNHFNVNNLSPSNIYLGINTIPSPQTYDMMVSANGENMHARDLGVTRVMLFNDSVNPARIVLTSGEDKFNPAILASRGGNAIVSGGGSGGGGGGVITGFTASLPSGNNNIGRVAVTEMPAVDFVLSALPPGTNNIGKVEVTKLPMLASDSNGKIGNVGVLGGLTITSMPPVALSGKVEIGKEVVMEQKSYTTGQLFYKQIDVQQTEQVLNVNLNRIIFISNDTDAELIVKINDVEFLLLGQEVIEELPITIATISLKRVKGNGMARIMGV